MDADCVEFVEVYPLLCEYTTAETWFTAGPLCYAALIGLDKYK